MVMTFIEEAVISGFISKVINCFHEKNYDKKFAYAQNLYDYFLSQFTDFDINNLVVQSSAE